VGNQTLYLTYRTASEAKAAFSKLNNFKFDKSHTLQCYTINDIRGFIEEQDSLQRPFQPPQFALTREKVQHNLDEQFRSQFVVREANMLYLNWLDHLDRSAKNALPSDFLPVDFVINKVVFSPLGSYLAVCSPEGTHLYYGATLAYKGLLPQVNASDVKFSSDERVIVTSNGGSTASRENFIIWALEEQVKIKAYKSHANQSLDHFQFSDDAKSLAVVLQNEVVLFAIGSLEELRRQVRLAE
jgi:WD40 repeat protein